MARLDVELITETAQALYVRALKVLPPDVKHALARAHARETHPRAREILATMLKNIDVAEERGLLVCQDTGTPVFKVRVGRCFPFAALGGYVIGEALTEGVRRATVEHPLRSSICHPLTRENPQTNTGWRIPVVDWTFLPDGEALDLAMMPKGSGSENMSFLRMLPPAAGLGGIKRFVIECVVEGGGKPCPPTIIGVGIGGTSDLCMKLAKEAIWRPVGEPHPDPDLAKLESELLEAVNMTGLGPMGLGGDTTALGVMVEAAYTHITQNPVAVTLQCWRGERASARISPAGRVEHGF
ncbi:MAG: fumarate hydratase [Candidatus Rokubacteria bacterium]|nr:fumarate hydratase [Candidatus Rokubacteria bacterium]